MCGLIFVAYRESKFAHCPSHDAFKRIKFDPRETWGQTGRSPVCLIRLCFLAQVAKCRNWGTSRLSPSLSPQGRLLATVSAEVRATSVVLRDSTACASSASPCSSRDVAVRFSPGCGSPPACADAKLTAAGRAARGPASIVSGTDLPPPASGCAPRPSRAVNS